MLTYIIHRLVLLVPTILGITAVVFFVMALSPGGVGGAAALSQEGQMDSKTREAMREYYNKRYGFDRPLIVQYGAWLNQISPIGFKEKSENGEGGEGFPASWSFGVKWPDLGRSFSRSRPVSELMLEALPITIMLNLIAAPIVYFVAIPLGLYMARHRGRDIDAIGGTLSLALWSIPTIWAGVMFIGYLGNRDYLYLFPTNGVNDITAPDMAFLPTTGAGWLGMLGFTVQVLLLSGILFAATAAVLALFSLVRRLSNAHLGPWRSPVLVFVGTIGFGLACWLLAAYAGLPKQIPADRGWLFDRLWHLVLPTVCMVYVGFASLAKLMRGALLESLSSHYVRTARAKGVSEHDVLWRHAFRNSLLPLITVAAGILPGLLAGSVVIEKIFSVPGMGLLMIDAIFARDREVILASTLIGGILGMLCILLADLAYVFADPRVSYDA